MPTRARGANGMTALTIVNVGYRSTNYWVLSAGRSRIFHFGIRTGRSVTNRRRADAAATPSDDQKLPAIKHLPRPPGTFP